MSEVDGTQLERDVLRFIALLRRLGISIGTGQAADAIRGLGVIDLRSRSHMYTALRAILLDSHLHEPLFAGAFTAFWRAVHTESPFPIQASSIVQPGEDRIPANSDTRQAGEGPSIGPATLERMFAQESAGAVDAEERNSALAYSASEELRHKNFAELSPDELVQVRRLLTSLTLNPLPRRTRRTRRSASGHTLDLRHTARRNLRYGGEVVILPRRRRIVRPRPLVLLCDISGSMDRYTRMLLYFLHAATQRSTSLESFVFGTRLTRITRQLRRRDPDHALDEVESHVLDFSGGTRIGDAVATFNRRWARRVLRGGAVVMIISDGWDRGEPGLLDAEMAHLHRSCHRLIWLNPLLGMNDYRPLTRGMAAALPHIDLFLPAHNLASLESLGELLRTLGSESTLQPRLKAAIA